MRVLKRGKSMAKSGDYYVITLKKTHIEWGTHRYTGSRGDILGEGYLPIPRNIPILNEIDKKFYEDFERYNDNEI